MGVNCFGQWSIIMEHHVYYSTLLQFNQCAPVFPGINVQKGKGRYRDTHIVTFAPRYLLDNRSTHRLAFAQREFARGKVKKKKKNIYFFDSLGSMDFKW